MPQHNYNTRLAAKLSNSSLNVTEKTPYVDLGSTKIEPQKILWVAISKNKNIYDRPKMDCARDFCCPKPKLWNSKYLILTVAVCFLSLPFISKMIRIGSDIERLKKSSESFKELATSLQCRLDGLEIALKDLKKGKGRDQLAAYVKEQIDQQENAEERTDFALETSGGRIVSLTKGTENYGKPRTSLFGVAICEGTHGPRALIQQGKAPGECWAFKGTVGGVIIKLLAPIHIDAITLEHISKNVSPTGQVNTAPKDGSIWGLQKLDGPPELIGQFRYDITKPLQQVFDFPLTEKPFEYIELRFSSNHGHEDFTCVYRVRVHGKLKQ